MKTNRDLYKAIVVLLKERNNAPTILLEQYLASLQVRSKQWKHEPAISLQTFFDLLAASFVPVPEAPEENTKLDEQASGFLGWDSTLCRQIQDLRQMRENGQMEDDERYFGIDAPSGGRWYNFDPCTYIECGVVGSLGGWEEGDEKGRKYVPGEVMVVDDKGEFVSRDPRELKREPEEIPELSWDKLREFLWCGQNYE